VFNIGTGIGTEVQEVADIISDYQIKIPKRPGEVLHSTANIDKVKNVLGWKWSIGVIDWIKKSF